MVHDLLYVSVVLHVVGTALGVGAAKFAEIHFTRFNADNSIDEGERETLGVTYYVMRIGLFMLVVTGFSFLLYYRIEENVTALFAAGFLAKVTIIGALLGNAIAMQARILPLEVGAPVSLTSWYAALVLGVMGHTDMTYVQLMGVYLLSIVVVGVLLKWARFIIHEPRTV